MVDGLKSLGKKNPLNERRFEMSYGNYRGLNPESTDNPTPMTRGRLDLNRYLGTWYEVARLPTLYQQRCAKSVAYYSWPTEIDRSASYDEITVKNTCLDSDGNTIDNITGKGEVISDTIPAELIVSFPGLPDPGDVNYVVIETDYDNYAIVSGSDKQTLFFLARDETVCQSLYRYMVARSKYLGYDVTRLIVDRGAVRQHYEKSNSNWNWLWLIVIIIVIIIIICAVGWACRSSWNSQTNTVVTTTTN